MRNCMIKMISLIFLRKVGYVTEEGIVRMAVMKKNAQHFPVIVKMDISSVTTKPVYLWIWFVIKRYCIISLD